jgi:hypothetical protein
MIRETNEWNRESAWKLICPICDCNFVHIVALKCMRCTDETTVTNDGILVKQTQNEMRGATITLQYSCESGHAGETTFQFHEGCVYLTHRVLTEAEALREDIWRD